MSDILSRFEDRKTHYYVEHEGDSIRVEQSDMTAGPKPLVWYQKGAYCRIMEEKITNLIDLVTDYQLMSLINVGASVAACRVWWDDGVQMDFVEYKDYYKDLSDNKTDDKDSQSDDSGE